VTAFAAFGVDAVIGQTIGYFNVTRDLFLSDGVEALPADRVMIELLETIVCDEPIVRRCRELRKRGYRVALDDWELRDPREHMLPEVDCVKVDLLAVPEKDLPWVVRTIRRHPVAMLAEKVEDAESHARCLKLGFDLFQGYYFARPTTLSSSKVDAGRASVLRAMQKLSTDAGIDEVADLFKSNANLGVNLLRLVNSVGLTRGTTIENVAQALSMLGQRQVQRWLALLLFAGGDEASFGSALLETAALRGRLMELLVAHDDGPATQDLRDRAFLAGMLSLADVLLGRPLEELAQELHVHDDIRAALQREPGGLGDLLALAERLEHADFAGVDELMLRAGVDAPRLLRAQAEARQWVTALMAG
jgi:EAL and modified HD-GYP domain-containing signal transduction protein